MNEYTLFANITGITMAVITAILIKNEKTIFRLKLVTTFGGYLFGCLVFVIFINFCIS